MAIRTPLRDLSKNERREARFPLPTVLNALNSPTRWTARWDELAKVQAKQPVVK